MIRRRAKHVLHINPFLVCVRSACLYAPSLLLPIVIFFHVHHAVAAACMKGMYTCGLVMFLLYFWHYSLWILFYPCLVQLSLMAYLVSLGIRFDGVLRESSAKIVEGGVDDSC